MYDAIRAGFDRVVFVVRREIEADVREFFAGKFEDRIAADYVVQDLHDVPEGFSVPADRSKPWGTAHAVLAAREAIDAPFAVINGDDFYGRDALRTIADYLSDRTAESTEYAMVGYRLDKTLSPNGTVSRGIVETDDAGVLVSIEEHTKLRREDGGVVSLTDDGSVRARFHGDEATSMNLFGFTPAAMAQFREEFAAFLERYGTEAKSEFYIPYAMNRIGEAGRGMMRVLRSDGDWFGVTYQEDRPEVVAKITELVDAGEYPRTLWG